jgi:hypothetical protein
MPMWCRPKMAQRASHMLRTNWRRQRRKMIEKYV